MLPETIKIYLQCIMLLMFHLYTAAQEAPSQEVIIPRIMQSGFELTPEANGYSLRISLPNGSVRDEDVKFENPGTAEQYLSVNGSSTIYFNGAINTVTYTADRNGYTSVVKYIYRKNKGIKPVIGAAALKASAG